MPDKLSLDAAAHVWVQLHETKRSKQVPVVMGRNCTKRCGPLDPSERELYELLTERLLGATKRCAN